MPSVDATDADETPIPPPWRGVRRLSLLVTVALLLSLIVWVAWRHIAASRYEKEIAKLRERGEPLLLSDFPRPEIADADNAATYWNHAIAAITPGVDCPSSSSFTFGDPPYSKQWFDLESVAVVANAPAIQMSLEAAKHRQVNWGPPPASPYFRQIFNRQLNQFRNLANHLGDAALYSHFKNRDAEAFTRVNALLDFADDIADQSNRLVDHLVAIGIRALAQARLEIIAQNVQLAGPGAAEGVSRETVAAMIDRLTDLSIITRQATRAVLAERAYGFDLSQWASDRQPILRPLFQLWSVKGIQMSTDAIVAASAPNQPAALARYNATFPAITASGFPPSAYYVPSFRLFDIEWRILCESRMVATLLALHLYEHDHGDWPKSLSLLVPNYLKAIPTDPYSATGQPVGYVVLIAPNSTVARPMLYCDPVPPKPADQVPPPTVCTGGWSNSRGRQWRDVTAWQFPKGQRHFR